MAKYIIEGGRRICGEISIKAAKNAVLPLMAAALLCEEPVTLIGCPAISDIDIMLKLLESLGVTAIKNGDDITLNNNGLHYAELPSRLTEALRSSVFLLSPMLVRFGTVRLHFPGGCAIGKRAIDIHIDGLKKLGVSVDEGKDFLYCNGANRHNGAVYLSFPSVGATENLILLSVLTKGTTYLYNCAAEPEVTDLANFLNEMGAKIKGAGTPVIQIEGVSKLYGGSYRPIGDRIAAATYLSAAVITGGEIAIKGVNPTFLDTFTAKISETTCQMQSNGDMIYYKSLCAHKVHSYAETGVYPCFPTDMQPLLMTLMATDRAEHCLVENVFESRFALIPRLNKMGANIKQMGKAALITGVGLLHGAGVSATDLRAGAALVVAALSAQGVSVVSDIEYVFRGYEAFHSCLNRLGANIQMGN